MAVDVQLAIRLGARYRRMPPETCQRWLLNWLFPDAASHDVSHDIGANPNGWIRAPGQRGRTPQCVSEISSADWLVDGVEDGTANQR
jgi:hypothetical protein